MQDFYQLLNNEFLKQKGSFTRPMAIISPMLAYKLCNKLEMFSDGPTSGSGYWPGIACNDIGK